MKKYYKSVDIFIKDGKEVTEIGYIMFHAIKAVWDTEGTLFVDCGEGVGMRIENEDKQRDFFQWMDAMSSLDNES